MLTISQLSAIMPHAGARAPLFIDHLNDAMVEFDIATPARQSAFLAQVAHESTSLNALSENLNYSAESLLRVFPKYFTASQAAVYAKQPERIANRVYANRMGNGPEESGDGWTHRGAGLIQATGKENQCAIADHFGIPRENIGDWLRTVEGAARSAGLFWASHGLNELADAGDFLHITKRINGGINGLAEREAFWERAKPVLGA